MRTTLLAILLVSGCGESTTPDDMAAPDMTAVEDMAVSPDLMPLQCKPAMLANFTPSYHPPRAPHAGVCSDAQIAAAVKQLGNINSFLGWKFSPGNQECGGCLVTTDDAAEYGPWLYRIGPNTFFTNARGCQEILTGDRGATSCAADGQAQDECAYGSCEPQCPIGASQAQFTAFNNCLNASLNAGCKTYHDALVNCMDDPDGGATDFCYRQTTDQASSTAFFVDLATLFCGQ